MNGTKEIPASWIWATVEDIADVASGSTPSTKDEENFGGNIPWITPADLSEFKGKLIEHGARNLSEKGLKSCSARLLPKGTVLFSSRAPIGYVAIADNPVATNQGFKNLVLHDGIFNEYVYYYLLGNKKLAESLASGTTFLEISARRIKKMPIPIPPTAEQKRIVGKIDDLLSRLDAAVKNLITSQKRVEQYSNSLIRDAARGDLTINWRKSHLFPEVQDSDMRPDWLPNSWRWMKAGEAFDIILGQSPPSSTYNYERIGLPFFQGSKEFGAIYPEINRWCSEPIRIAEKGDVLISVRAPVGDTNICPEKACIGRGLAAIRQKGCVQNRFILYLFRAMKNTFIRQGTGTTFDAITGTRLRSTRIPIPPELEQQEILTILENNFSAVKNMSRNLEQSYSLSEHLRRKILHSAFKGNLVPQNENDEPAGELLERIRKDAKTMQSRLI